MAMTSNSCVSRWDSIFVRHGGIFFRVSPKRLNKVHTTDNQNESEPSGLQEQERVRMADCGRDETNNLGSPVQPKISENVVNSRRCTK